LQIFDAVMAKTWWHTFLVHHVLWSIVACDNNKDTNKIYPQWNLKCPDKTKHELFKPENMHLYAKAELYGSS